MLTPAEEDRVEELLPSSVDVEYAGDSHEYELTPFWGPATDNPNPDYPMVVLQYDSQNDAEEQRQPLNDIADREDDGDDVVETEVAEVSDLLSITIATTTDHDGKTPASVRSHQIARLVWRALWFNRDVLRTPGENGERSIRLDMREEGSLSPTRVEDTYRIAFTARLHHSETVERETPGVAEFDTSTDTTTN